MLNRILFVASLLLILAGCSYFGGSYSESPPVAIPHGTVRPETPRPPPATDGLVTPGPGAAIGLSLEEAVAIARANISKPDADLHSHAPGTYEIVVQVLFGPQAVAEDLPGTDGQTLVWGLIFVTPTDMITVYVDMLTGAALYIEETGRPDELPEPHKSDIVFGPPTLHLANSTTLQIELLINDIRVGSYAPETTAEIDPNQFSSPPWTFVVRTESGRELMNFAGAPESVWSTVGDFPHAGTSIGGRLFLSCGQLIVYAGKPMSGPPPGPSYPPNDCEP